MADKFSMVATGTCHIVESGKPVAKKPGEPLTVDGETRAFFLAQKVAIDAAPEENAESDAADKAAAEKAAAEKAAAEKAAAEKAAAKKAAADKAAAKKTAAETPADDDLLS